MSDLIDRQAAIDAVVDELDRIDHVPQWVFDALSSRIKSLTSAEPHSIKLNQGQSSDMISRQAVLDNIAASINQFGGRYTTEMINMWGLFTQMILQMPSAEPHTFRVIDTKTRKEADTYEIALKEEWAKSLCYCDMEGFAIGEDGTLMLLDECGNCTYCPEGRFEVEWDG